jgi:hypothetical protein
MRFAEIGSFSVAHAERAWPWIAVNHTHASIAFYTQIDRIETRTLRGAELAIGATFALPPTLGALLPTGGFALDNAAERVALYAGAGATQTLATLGPNGEGRQSNIDALLGAGHALRAIAFDRLSTRLWLSGEHGPQTFVALLDATTHTLIGRVDSAGFSLPAIHELYTHSQDDAVLLVAACGQEGTFARVVGWSGDAVTQVETALDEGSVPAGFVGFSADGARVHFAEAEELRTHAWPGLQELASVELADDFVSSYAGAVLGGHVFVDGAFEGDEDDAVMRFEPAGLHGVLLTPPFPLGMWAARLGSQVLITVEARGEPATARALHLELPARSN